jgi:hypothetical protein
MKREKRRSSGVGVGGTGNGSEIESEKLLSQFFGVHFLPKCTLYM